MNEQDIRETVEDFAEEMIAILKAKSGEHPSGWYGEQPGWYLTKAQEHLNNARHEAFMQEQGKPEDYQGLRYLQRQIIHTANYLMMVWSEIDSFLNYADVYGDRQDD